MELNTALVELPKLSREAAVAVIKSIYSGHHQELLLDFVQGQIKADIVARDWNKAFYTGDLLSDVKEDSLTVVNRLELLAFCLYQVGFRGTDLLGQLKDDYPLEEVLKAIALLMTDLNKKDKLRVRANTERSGIASKLEAYFATPEDTSDIFGNAEAKSDVEKEEELATAI